MILTYTEHYLFLSGIGNDFHFLLFVCLFFLHTTVLSLQEEAICCVLTVQKIPLSIL